ncbi:Uncharacterised protein [Nocardia otitidiscaviarum]|uniref:Uncharacterized protein n=1 Tax=Nocardia otitidiscaviarum TaxID=1823 RepID=A0A378Y7V2_9NOCA|nr:Uncharacterised protein [Nocardia otitidiscaviarum]
MRFDCLSHRNREWGRSNPGLAMQVHINCHLDACHTKAAAWSALVDAGKIGPDSNRPVRTEP